MRSWWIRSFLLGILACFPLYSYSLDSVPLLNNKNPLARYIIAKSAVRTDINQPVTEQDLLSILKNEKSRNQLISELELLAKTEAEVEKRPSLKDRIIEFSKEIVRVSENHFSDWKVKFSVVMGACWNFVLLLSHLNPEAWLLVLKLSAVGFLTILSRRFLAELFRKRLTQSIRDSLAQLTPSRRNGLIVYSLLSDVAVLGLSWLMGYFTLIATLTYSEGRHIAELFLIAYAVSNGALLLLQNILFEQDPALRLLPLSDASAHKTIVWSKEFIQTTAYSLIFLSGFLDDYFGPLSVSSAFKEIVGIFLFIRVSAVILRTREYIAAWIRPHIVSEGAQSKKIIPLFRTGFAKIWHILAIIYLLIFLIAWIWNNEEHFWQQLEASSFTTGILLLAFFINGLLRRFTLRGFTLKPIYQQQWPKLEKRLNYFMPVINSLSHCILILFTGALLLQVWEFFTWNQLLQDNSLKNFFISLIRLHFIILGSGAIWILFTSWIEKRLTLGPTSNWKRQTVQRKNRTLLYLLRNTVTLTMVLVAICWALTELGLEVAPLIAGAGIISLAIGFGAQSLVKDVINGLFNVFENTLEIGAWVEVNNRKGWVEKVTLRTVSLRSNAGVLHVIPFSEISTVDNHTKDYSCYLVDLCISFTENYETVMQAIERAGEALQKDPAFGPDILVPLEILGLAEFEEGNMKIRCRIRVKPGKQFGVGREFNRLIKVHFDKTGIRLALPPRAVYTHSSEDYPLGTST